MKCILKHHTLQKIKVTLLSLSKEKKLMMTGLKRLRRSRHLLACSLGYTGSTCTPLDWHLGVHAKIWGYKFLVVSTSNWCSYFGGISPHPQKFIKPDVTIFDPQSFSLTDFDMHLLESATSLSGLDLLVFSDTYRKNSKIWDTSNKCHSCPKNRKSLM